jgi:hypothetical protein
MAMEKRFSIMFAGEAKPTKEGNAVDPLKAPERRSTLVDSALLISTRLDLKCLPGTNTLAYHGHS